VGARAWCVCVKWGEREWHGKGAEERGALLNRQSPTPNASWRPAHEANSVALAQHDSRIDTE